jgi:hypothetical protein
MTAWRWPATTDRRWAANPTGQGLVGAYRWLRLLVDRYALDRRYLPIERAVEYVLSCQTDEGDTSAAE